MSVLNITPKSKYKPETAEFLLSSLPHIVNNSQKLAQEQLKAQGLPTPKLESWGFSNLPAALKKIEHTNFSASDVAIQNIAFSRGIPLWVQNYFEHTDSNPSLHMMNMAMLADVYTIDIAPNLHLDEPMQIDWVLNQSACAHIILRVQKNSSVTLLERQVGEAGWRLGRLIVILDDNAHIEHVRLMNDNHDSCVATQNLDITTGRDATYHGFILNKGSAFARTEIHGIIAGTNSEITLNGLQLAAGKQIADTTILIEHQQPHGRSNQFYKTILSGESVGIFQGKIHVHQIAQKTDGYQMSNGILLSKGAQMNTKPQLEIYADDVKCSHGTTTGQLDETPLFYLCSRGISEIDARRMLLESAMGDVIDKISNESLKELASFEAQEWLRNVYA